MISERTRDLELKPSKRSARKRRVILRAFKRPTPIDQYPGVDGQRRSRSQQGFQITGANTAFAELLETTEPDLRTKTLRDIVSPDDLLQLTGIEGMISSGTVRDMHVSFVTPTVSGGSRDAAW